MPRDHSQRDFARTLRTNSTNAEKHLWQFLRAQQLRNHKFRRQSPIGPYIADFVCFSHKLIIELDGPQHLEPTALDHDPRRTAWLTAQGFQVLRFRNQELDENIHAVLDTIATALEQREASHQNPPSPTLPAEGREPE
jgi:very-short-patch-repair endonuclease